MSVKCPMCRGEAYRHWRGVLAHLALDHPSWLTVPEDRAEVIVAAIAHAHPAQRRDAAKCGTLSGYNVHRRRGEDACDACLEATRAHNRQQRERRARLRAAP